MACFSLTLMVLWLLVGCAWTAVLTKELENADEDSLVLLHVLFRHGERTPDPREIFPKLVEKNQTYYPIGFGELTNEGKRREYQLGKSLRKRYGNFLGDIYTPDSIHPQSTDYNRTKMSLQLTLASLYPPVGEQVWEKDFNWQPIPFFYTDYNDDHLLGDARYNCRNYQNLYKEYENSPAGIARNKKYENLYNYLSEHLETNITHTEQVYNLYFMLHTHQSMGLSLPDWTKSVWPSNITEVAVEEYAVSLGTTPLRRLASGQFLKKLLDDSASKANEEVRSQNIKIYLYSAHENNIAWFLTLLDIFYPHVPGFGSNLVLELHKVKEIYGLRIFYQDDQRIQPKMLKIPGCTNICPLSQFAKLIEEFLPVDGDVCDNEKSGRR